MPLPRLTQPPTPPLTLGELSAPQLTLLRAQYLNPAIIPAGCHYAWAVVANGQLAGAIGFDLRLTGDWCDVYMMTDFAVHAPVPRLSKLVAAAALSAEVRDLLEAKAGRRVRTIGTTAFTTKPVSMKYRGVYELFSRKDGKLNYVGNAGRWTLAECLDWWGSRHAA